MAHYKYIKKNGKYYGPYLYENKRVNGKIVTSYLGNGNKKMQHRSIRLLIFACALAAFLLLLLFFWRVSPTGRISLDLDKYYESGDELSGKFIFRIKEGELIPIDTKLVVSLGEISKEFSLNELIDKEALDGDFFIEGSDLNGRGIGYGLVGAYIEQPLINFELKIESNDLKSETKENKNDDIESPENTESDIKNATDNETNNTETKENKNENIESENKKADEGPLKKEEETNINKGDIIEPIDAADEPVEQSETEYFSNSVESDINDISEGEGQNIITGSVIGETKLIIEGAISRGDEFNYNLEEGQTAEIVPGSVMINGETVEDDKISLIIENKILKVTTNYTLIKEGFGEEYLGDGELLVEIDMNKFGLKTEEDTTLNVKLIYDDKILAETEKNVIINNKKSEATIKENNESLEIIENETSINETITRDMQALNLSIIKGIPNIKISKNSIYKLNLSEFFIGSERYSFSGLDIGVDFNGDLATITPNNGFTGFGKGKITGYYGNKSIESNEFDIIVASGNITISTIRHKIVAGQPVKWVKNISLDVSEDFLIELDKRAENISVKKIIGENSLETEYSPSLITGRVSEETDNKGIIDNIRNILRFLTGKAIIEIELNSSENLAEPIAVILDGNASQYIVEYYTEAPLIFEKETKLGKEIIISGPDELNYEDVIASISINNSILLEEVDKIKVLWHENFDEEKAELKSVWEVEEIEIISEIDDFIGNNNSQDYSEIEEINIKNEKNNNRGYIRKEIPFSAYDLTGDGNIDSIEWVVPYLSNQTFEIILINKAEHLDNNRIFIKDIYGLVRERDDNWTEAIPAGDYVRVVFEQNLTKDNDITLYARSNYSNISIDVFEIYGTEAITSFNDIFNEGEYKVYLNNLSGEQDSFDLFINGTIGGIEFDWIVDPKIILSNVNTYGSLIKNNITTEPAPYSHITLNDSRVMTYFAFDAENATTLYDYSSLNKDGVVGGNAIINSSGFIGGGINFDGNNDFVDLGAYNEIESIGNLTISLWVRSNSAVNPGLNLQIIFKAIGTNTFQFQWNSLEQIEFRVWNSTNTRIDSASGLNAVADTNWHHVVGLINSSQNTIYVDNIAGTTNPSWNGLIQAGSSNLMLSRDSTTLAWNGTIDEVMIINRSLSRDEITALYNNQSYRFITPATQLFNNVSFTAGDNRVNVTTNSTLLFGTNISLRVREIGNGLNTTWQNISNGVNQLRIFNISTATSNISLEFDFIPANGNQSGNFYSPVLRDNVVVDTWNEPAPGGANNAPNNPFSKINSTLGTNYTLQNLSCIDTLIDPDGNFMNVSVEWYNQSQRHLYAEFNNSYANNSAFFANLQDGNTTKGHNWSCAIKLFDGTVSSNWVNTSVNLSILNSLPVVTLSAPAHGNITINRTPVFSWTGNDDDGDTLEYELNLTCYYIPGGACSTDTRYITRGTIGTATSYLTSPFLAFLFDNNYYYNWSVRSWDGDSFGSWTAHRNISIQSDIVISLANASIQFGALNLSASQNTTTGNPSSIVLRNNGNTLLNVSLNFTSLFLRAPSPSDNLQYRISNNTANCFISTGTQTSFAQAPTLLTRAIHQMNFTSGYQTACSNLSVDVLVTVPSDEPPGNKSSLITFVASLGEPGIGAT